MPPITHEPLLLLARLQRLPTTRYTWAFVSLLAGAFIIEAFDIGSLSVILPILKPLMQLSPAQVGLLVASSVIGLTIGMIPAGFLADRLGRKRVLIGGMLWFAGLTGVSALALDFRSLLLLRGFSGLGMAPAFIVPYALVSEMVSSRTRAAFAGVLEASLGIGYVAVPILGLVVLPRFARDRLAHVPADRRFADYLCLGLVEIPPGIAALAESHWPAGRGGADHRGNRGTGRKVDRCATAGTRRHAGLVIVLQRAPARRLARRT